MSMHALGKRGIPKGVVISAARNAILDHLRVHGASTPAPLLEALLSVGAVSADELSRNPYWLNHQLTRLGQRGHVTRSKNEADVYVWSLAEAGEAEDAVDLVVVAQVAAPRHIDRMRGPVYQPPCPAPARAGAMDYARAPSLMGSRRVPFRGGM